MSKFLNILYRAVPAFLLATTMMGVSIAAGVYSEEKPRNPLLTKTKAAVIALQSRPGWVMTHQLRSYGPEYNQRYVFGIESNNAQMYRVSVDGTTGQVMENTLEK